MKWQMPIGVDNFWDIRSKHYYFVDKTDFIRQLIDGHSAVTLITRPRRFGKTLTLSMLEYFFSSEKEVQSRHLFDGLAIDRAGTDYMAHRGQYPVLFLSLKDWKFRIFTALKSWIRCEAVILCPDWKPCSMSYFRAKDRPFQNCWEGIFGTWSACMIRPIKKVSTTASSLA